VKIVGADVRRLIGRGWNDSEAAQTPRSDADNLWRFGDKMT